MGAKEVAAGSQWLDENFPGWEREIDLGTLQMGSCEDCICGQSLRKFASSRGLSGFEYAMTLAGVHWGDSALSRWANDHGFWDPTDESLWRELIKSRFSDGTLSDVKDEW